MAESGQQATATTGRNSTSSSSAPHTPKAPSLSIKFAGPRDGTGSPLNEGGGGPMEKRFQVYKEEVLASHMMKTLTQKYGTRGKSAKFIFLQAFEEELRSGGGFKKTQPKIGISCGEAAEVTEAEVDIDMEVEEDGQTKGGDPVLTQRELATKAGTINFSLGEMMSRPSAMVTQSAFVRRLEDQVKREITRTNCPSPVYEMSWLYEEIRRESLKTSGGGGGVEDSIYDTFSVRDSLEEPEEKMAARLKIYKRAFSALILHFEALRPILRDIKRNYDAMLMLRDRQLREAATVKRNIHHVEQALERKMAGVRYEGFKQLTEMEKQCFLLMRHVDKQDGAIRTMTDILNRLENSLSEEHDLRKDSEDQRKLLILEINEVRRKLGMQPRPQGISTIIAEEDEFKQEEDVITKDDPLVLRTALETTRKNLSDAMHRLLVLEADYADVIPRHEYEKLEATMAELEEQHRTTNETFEILSSQVQGLRDQIESLTAERNTTNDIVKALRVKATPRPSWEKIADHIEGGLPRWEAIYNGKATSEIVVRMAEELSGKRMTGPPVYLAPLGTGPTVPRYLRYENRVRARGLSRRDVAVLIQDIYQTRIEELDLLRRWNESKDEESSTYGAASSALGVPDEKPNIVAFPDFVADYFDSRYHLVSLRMEWTYNIMEACKLLGGIDQRLVQFQHMLQGKVDETVYHLFRSQVGLLRDALVKKSADTNNNSGSLQVSHFRKVLQDTFPEKTEEEIVRLMQAASKQCGVHADYSIMRYTVFFVMTDEGLIGEFIEELTTQFDEDRMKYVYEILGQLLSELGVSLSSAEREDDPAGDTDVTMPQMYNSILVVDPTITDEKLGTAMAWIFIGASSLPGMAPKGQYLVEYLKNKMRRSEMEGADEEDDENDDDDFERSLRDVREDTNDEDMSPKARKAMVKKLRYTNLRTVVRRLKGGAFLRHGRRYPLAVESPPATGDGEGQAVPEGEGGEEGSQAKGANAGNPDGVKAEGDEPLAADEAKKSGKPAKKDKGKKKKK